MVDLQVEIAGLKMRNPVTAASGTFGFGEEYADFIDLDKLGGIFVKGLTIKSREGNDYPRMAETPSGMLNAVGLQNKGVDYFIDSIYPRIKHWNTEIFPNINGSVIADYVAVAEKLNEVKGINGIELNISCPNVKEGGMAFGVSCTSAIAVTKAVRKAYDKTLIVKLSPNVTDITEIAKGVESAGADSVSLVNTLLGMAIDAKTKKPLLSTITGGLSGPAIKPIALRMVWQVYNAVKIPIVGMGGIMNGNDAIEFMLAGSSAIQVGTANYIDPQICEKIVDEIEQYCSINGITKVTDLIGGLITD
ncbi:MAG: dihydroorotate dehydrogenase [Bacteroidales bacterium]|jgi:dihydroorotate dehydrogenase (NAD+) catalytic subunit|nr:dihydroorotate dehydrogenase B catalytic subunit [Lentimicrobiaceae bacterium]MDG1136088.1 dihydroorotate dehydrogenase [Bacteroidales bacterium]MDG1900794.1 dihydroorotate dehydrogenase [Bacteroidales bacterium]MDG2080820.1 dihydroorotate dehydrogenase [Bacteroidales bacterium]|tara:strand:+ start:224 stop:1138 length:915 start_codon:yes stop_codon:yes gene_type:complete